jgi:hypothetical protein
MRCSDSASRASASRQGSGTDKEASDRFIHAISMMKAIADARTFEAAKQMGLHLYQAWRA